MLPLSSNGKLKYIKIKIKKYGQKWNKIHPLDLGGFWFYRYPVLSVNIIKNYIDIEAPED